MEEQRVNPFCSSHVHNEQSIAELKGIVLKLTEGMAQVRESMVQLAEAFKNLERVDRRLDKLEELHRVDSGKQQERLEGLERNVYKAGGVIAGLLLILEIGFKFWGK